jgi:hypothetical protein
MSAPTTKGQQASWWGCNGMNPAFSPFRPVDWTLRVGRTVLEGAREAECAHAGKRILLTRRAIDACPGDLNAFNARNPFQTRRSVKPLPPPS